LKKLLTVENSTYERFKQFGDDKDSEDEVLKKILDIAEASLKTLDLE